MNEIFGIALSDQQMYYGLLTVFVISVFMTGIGYIWGTFANIKHNFNHQVIACCVLIAGLIGILVSGVFVRCFDR